MRYSKIVQLDTVSEWRDAYINYEYLKMFILIIEEMLDGATSYQTIFSEEGQHTTKGIQFINRLKVLASQVNELFLHELSTSRQICKTFCIVKLNQVTYNYQLCERYNISGTEEEKKKLLVPFLEYTYIEAVYLSNTMQSCEDQQKRIISKHKKIVKNYLATAFPSMQNFIPVPNNNVMGIAKKLQKLNLQLRMSDYEKLSQRLSRRLRRQKLKSFKQQLKELPKDYEPEYSESFSFGLWVGLFICVIILMSILLVYRGFSADNDPIFNRDFPVWRGIAYIILYIWSLGLNVFYYNEYNISHNIILNYQSHHFMNFTSIFNIAGVFSTIFGILFALYALSITQVISLGSFPPRYLALIMWGLFLLFLFNPLPTKYHRTRIYAFKNLAKMFISPLIPITFQIEWFTSQLLSLITIFEDLVYSICYYTSLDFEKYDEKSNQCRSPARISVFVFALVIFAITILQNIRSAYDKKKILSKRQLLVNLKTVLKVVILILSFVWLGQSLDAIFGLWIGFSVISIVFSYIWDIRVDFGLFRKNAQFKFLRNKIMYAPYLYYIVILANLPLRFAWVLTLSPNIAQGAFKSFELFRLITGGLQILRRGLWNLVVMQQMQIKLCNKLQAMPSYFYTLKSTIEEKAGVKKQNVNTMQLIPSSQNFIIKEILSQNILIQPNIESSLWKSGKNLTYNELIDKIRFYEQQVQKTRKLLKKKKAESDKILLKLKKILNTHK